MLGILLVQTLLLFAAWAGNKAPSIGSAGNPGNAGNTDTAAHSNDPRTEAGSTTGAVGATLLYGYDPSSNNAIGTSSAFPGMLMELLRELRL